MAWIPMFARPKEPCATCGSHIANAPLQGDCEYTRGRVFCTLDCRITFRWRKKFSYLQRLEVDPGKYVTQRKARESMRCWYCSEVLSNNKAYVASVVILGERVYMHHGLGKDCLAEYLKEKPEHQADDTYSLRYHKQQG